MGGNTAAESTEDEATCDEVSIKTLSLDDALTTEAIEAAVGGALCKR